MLCWIIERRGMKMQTLAWKRARLARVTKKKKWVPCWKRRIEIY
jgi:hypothetical protein